MPAGKPAPPRPRSPERSSSAIVAAAPRATAAARPSPGCMTAARMRSRRSTWLWIANRFSGHWAQRHLAADERADRADPLRRQPRDGPIVDQQRRPLIAQPGAARACDRHQPVAAHLAQLQPERVQHALAQRVAARHLIGDVVAEPHPKPPLRLRREEAVEPHHALDVGPRHAEARRQLGDRRWRHVAQRRRHLVEDLHQPRRITTVTLQHRGQVQRRHGPEGRHAAGVAQAGCLRPAAAGNARRRRIRAEAAGGEPGRVPKVRARLIGGSVAAMSGGSIEHGRRERRPHVTAASACSSGSRSSAAPCRRWPATCGSHRSRRCWGCRTRPRAGPRCPCRRSGR